MVARASCATRRLDVAGARARAVARTRHLPARPRTIARNLVAARRLVLCMSRPRSVGPAILRAIAILLAVAAALVAGAGRVTATGLEAGGLTAIVSGSVAADPERAAELQALDLITNARAAVGLVPFRVDTRLRAIARARSTDMRDRRYFAHETPDGRSVFDMLGESAIAWTSAGEVIAWNDVPDPGVSAERTVRDWLASPAHRDILLEADLNYVGLAAALDPLTGRRTWTAVAIRGPDRTPPVARLHVDFIEPSPAGRAVALSWSGADIPLSVGAAGLRDFTLQVRTGTGPWRPVLRATTRTHSHATIPLGVGAVFRVRAIDRSGNIGAWATVRVEP
jgi:uncharacterized protein YkwD